MELYFEEIGPKEAPTVVLLHGGLANSIVWEGYKESLKEFHCIMIDFPEHGKSAEVFPFSMEKTIDAIAEIIKERAHGGKAHLVGHSMGGLFIVHFLNQYPELVDRAIIGSATLIPNKLMERLSNKLFCKVWAFLTRTLLKAEYVNSDMVQRMYQMALKYAFVPEQLDKVRVHTLVVAGEKEPSFIQDTVGILVDTLPNAQGYIIKKRGHEYQYKYPNEFLKVILPWLQGISLIK